jgi:sugar phosphate isomerase/epimerase
MLKIAGRLDEKKIDGSLTALKRDLDYFKGLGLHAMEIPVHALDVIRHGYLDKKLLRETLRILREYDFTYSVHAPDHINLMNTPHRELHLAVLRSTMEFACETGVRVVVYHAGQYIPYNEFPLNRGASVTKDESMNLLATEEAILRDLAKEYPHISIAVENARPYLFHSPYCYAERTEALREQILNVGCKNVGVNLDVGHLYLAATFYGFDLFEELQQVRDLVTHCHIHDNFGLPTYYHEKEQSHLVPFGRGDCHMPVGWGEVPIRDILAHLMPDFDGILVMELRGRYYESVQESLETLSEICNNIECIRNISAGGK